MRYTIWLYDTNDFYITKMITRKDRNKSYLFIVEYGSFSFILIPIMIKFLFRLLSLSPLLAVYIVKNKTDE